MTFNRKLILEALTDDSDGLPPHSANSVFYTLENAFNFKWDCEPYKRMKTLPSIIQIHRTLRDLWHSGAIVGTRVKEDGFNGALPSWVVRYQLSGDVYRNGLLAEIKTVIRKVRIAKYGSQLFGGVFDMGLPANEVKPLADKVRSLMQKTHPDKAVGYENEFAELKAALDLIKSGIPLPTPTHTAGDRVSVEVTRI